MSASVDPRADSSVGSASGESSRAPRRARLAAYALWQLRDYAVDRGAPTIIVAMLLGYMTLESVREKLANEWADAFPTPVAQFGSREAAHAAMMSWLNYEFLNSALGALVFVGALFAMNGIVANDRKLGYYRFLFAKPMAPPRYYGQAFLVHFAGFLGVIALLGLLHGLLVWPVLTWTLMGVVAIVFLCYAGIAFALSAAARWDWLSLVAVSAASVYLWKRYGGARSGLAKLLYLLPPLHRLEEIFAAATVRPAFLSGAAPDMPWNLLWWIAGYGAACFVAGLIVLRHRRLAIV